MRKIIVGILNRVRKYLLLAHYINLPLTIMKGSNWYRSIFPDAERILKVGLHQDILNFGSNPGKYAFDYSGTGVNGYNLAVGPETLTYDYIMLKNYHSYLDDNGPRIALFPICPMSLCKKEYLPKEGETYRNYRYYPFLHRAFLNDFDKKFYSVYVQNPKGLWKSHWKDVLCSSLRKDRYKIAKNPLNVKGMILSADNYIKSWSLEFCWDNLDILSIPDNIRDNLAYNKNVISQIVIFCKERNIKPIIILTPISRQLYEKFSDTFRQVCIYDVINDVNVVFLNYIQKSEVIQHKFFVDALCLNKTGRRVFTKMVLSDIQKQNN